MAAIYLEVTPKGFKIDMDQWEWKGLTVNEKPVLKNQTTGHYVYGPKNFDMLRFTATANLTATNPGNVFVLEGDDHHDYVCVIWYTNDPFQLEGILVRTTKILGAKDQTFYFSQGMMTGYFQKGN